MRKITLHLLLFLLLSVSAQSGFGTGPSQGFGSYSPHMSKLEIDARDGSHILLVTKVGKTTDTLKADYELTNVNDKKITVQLTYPITYVKVDSILKAPQIPSADPFGKSRYSSIKTSPSSDIHFYTQKEIAGKTLPIISDRDVYDNTIVLELEYKGGGAGLVRGYSTHTEVCSTTTNGTQYILIAKKHEELYYLQGVREFGLYPIEKAAEIDSLSKIKKKIVIRGGIGINPANRSTQIRRKRVVKKPVKK